MQAYASAQLTPLESESERRFSRPVVRAAQRVSGGTTSQFRDDAGRGAVLASLILDGLDEDGLAALARRLLPHLDRSASSQPTPGHAAYTVASLAEEVGVSQKAIRCAIARRELQAVKRGARWMISAAAVQAWATASNTRRRTSCNPARPAPKAAGPSLRSIFCGDASGDGAR
jgi:excisionase family DNA binding protein